MNSKRAALAVFLIAYAAFSIHLKHGLHASGSTGVTLKVSVGSPAPDFTLPDMTGNLVRLEELRTGKKLTLINFWATWCAPCRIEMPQLVKIYSKFKDQGFEIVAVSADEDLGDLESYLNEKRPPFPVLADRDRKVSELYGVDAYPTSILIDADGKVLMIFQGIEEYMEFHVERFLKEGRTR